MQELGHEVFFDEWDIKVGQCILTEVERGISESDFVIILLSPNSVVSQWVEREWKAKYWDEVQKQTIGVVPVLLADCAIPTLLKSKKYADFRTSYLKGLRELNAGLGGDAPVVAPLSTTSSSAHKGAGTSTQVMNALQLVAALSDRDTPLSKTLPDLIRFAQEADNAELERVARYYLFGGETHTGKYDDLPDHKKVTMIEMYVCLKGELNMSYLGWGGDANRMMHHVENDKDFAFRRLSVSWPIVDIEAQAASAKPDHVCVNRIPASSLITDPKNPNHKFTAYFRSDGWGKVLLGMRRELIKMLRVQVPSSAPV